MEVKTGRPEKIEVHGARVHNLKNVDVEIPLNRIVGIAGVSGSGKSSLALGVLYAEGSRRYLESLSTYTRRRMTQAARADVDEVLADFASGDILLLQNEVNLLPYIVDKAYEKGMVIALNPSPYNEKLDAVDMTKISIFLLNEVEGAQISGSTDPKEILKVMLEKFPHARIVLTLGKDGAIYADQAETYFQPIFSVKTVDTTAAGDTFTGYFLAGLTEGMPIPDILRMSAKASSIAVTRSGAVPSIPYRKEVMEALQEA